MARHTAIFVHLWSMPFLGTSVLIAASAGSVTVILPDTASHKYSTSIFLASSTDADLTVIRPCCIVNVVKLMPYSMSLCHILWSTQNMCKMSLAAFLLLNKKAARVEVNISLAFLHWVEIALHPWPFVSNIAIFVLKGDVKLQLTN